MSSDPQNKTHKRNPRTSRRELLKRTLVVLGAAAIAQPYGGVFADAPAPTKSKKHPHKNPPPPPAAKKNLRKKLQQATGSGYLSTPPAK
jgi:hypothetical protein